MPGPQRDANNRKDKRVLVLFLFGISLLILDLVPLQKAQVLVEEETVEYPLTVNGAEKKFTLEEGKLPPRLAFFFNRSMAINRASRQDLSLLPGIGEQLADRIVSFRERNGVLNKRQDLEQIPGIGRKMSNRIASLVSFEQP
jgi:competence ComEA-like helix-hairpin-helix protein